AAAAVNRFNWIPTTARAALAASASRLPASEPKSMVYRVRRLGIGLARTPLEQYASWITIFDETAKRALYAPEFARCMTPPSFQIFRQAVEVSDAPTLVERIANADIQYYL